MSPLRPRVEQRSAVLLTLLAQRPAVLFVGVVGLLVLSALLPDAVGRLVVLPVLVLAVWLTYLSWPALRPGDRLLRLVVVGLLVLLVVLRPGP